jgi:hypothetical protein
MPKDEMREFRVHVRHIARHHAQVVRETSFEAAAVAYIEVFHHAENDDHELSVLVHDIGTGHEHCFRMDLDTGEAAPC